MIKEYDNISLDGDIPSTESNKYENRPCLIGTNQYTSNEIFRKYVDKKSSNELELFLKQLTKWIYDSENLEQQDFEQYKIVKTCLDGRTVGNFQSIRKLFKTWKLKHPSKIIKEHDGLPLFTYNFNICEDISEKKRKELKSNFEIVSQHLQTKLKEKEPQTKEKEILKINIDIDPFEHVKHNDIMNMSFYHDTLTYVSKIIGHNLSDKEILNIENGIKHLNDYKTSDGKYNVKMVVEDRQIVSKQQVLKVIEKYYPDIAKYKLTFSKLLKQIPNDENVNDLIKSLVVLYNNKIKEYLLKTFLSILKQLKELDGSSLRNKCLAQGLAGLEHLIYIRTFLMSNDIYNNLSNETTLEFRKSLTISFGKKYWKQCLCKLMKYPQHKIRNFQSLINMSNENHNKPNHDKPNHNNETLDKSNYDKSNHNNKTLDKPNHNNKTLDKSKYDKSNYDKSKYDKSNYDKSNYDKSKYDKSNYDKSNYDKSKYDKSKNKNVNKREKSGEYDSFPKWQQKHFDGYRCLDGNIDGCQCGSKAHWKHIGKAIKDNAIANKIVIENAIKDSYLPKSILVNSEMIEWLTSGYDNIRIRNCNNQLARYQFFKAYIEDLMIENYEKKYKPIVIAVCKINNLEHLELFMEYEDYKKESQRWDNGELKLVFNRDSTKSDILDGMKNGLNTLFNKNRQESSFQDGKWIFDWIFNSYSSWKYHLRQLDIQNQKNE